jgi:hypothetical protein
MGAMSRRRRLLFLSLAVLALASGMAVMLYFCTRSRTLPIEQALYVRLRNVPASRYGYTGVRPARTMFGAGAEPPSPARDNQHAGGQGAVAARRVRQAGSAERGARGDIASP